ncbi:MAG: right-handed parallel beta-helix repeat-containing protein, partial [Candidatus Buchananbacteria bacterium]
MNASQFRIKKLYTTAMILGLFLVVILLSQFFDNSKFAQAAVGVPRLLNYQGKVANSAGTAVTDGNYNFRFRLYTVSSGGTAVWTERWTSTSTAVTLNHGIFSVNLGNIATLANVDFSQDTYYLQVDFDSDSNGSWDESFSPRKQITSAVYAFNANIVTGTATTTEATSTKAYIANVLKVATTTEAAGQKLIVGGDSYFGGNIYVTGNATTSILRVNSFNLNGDDITDITGSGLSIIDGALTATGFAPTGFSGAWQTLTGNILTPTSTGAGILINAASSTITQLNVNSVTSTSRLVVGSITPTTNDPLWVGGSAYVSSNLGIGTTPTVGLDLAADKSIRLTGGTSFPIAPAEGQIFFRTDTYQLYVYANGKWQADRSTATKIVAANNSVNKEKADYVVPDGSTSAQNTINTALAALPIGGGIVYLSEGTYVVDGSVNINASSTTLMGTGAGTVIKLKDNFNSAIKIIKATGLLSKVLIRDLKVDGNKANQTSGSMTGIVLGDESYSSSLSDELGSDVRDSMVTNCWVENIIDGQYNAGILSKGGRANIITNNVSRNNGVGIFLYYPGPYNLVSNNMVENNNAVGIYFGSTYFGTLNTISGNNVVGNGGTGISVFDADTLTISDNTVADNHGSGIELVEATVYTMVSNNIIEGNYQHGIKFGGGSSNTASGNFIYGNSRESANTYDGIFVTFGSGNCMIQNNTIRRSINVTESLKYQRYGITIDSVDDNSGCLIANNNLTNSGISGDINNLADTIISNNITAKDYLTVSKANSTSTALTVTQSGAGYAALISGGNVGIGLSTPTSTLSVKNSLAVWGGANDVFAVNYLGNATTTGYFVVGAANPNSNLASGTLWSTYTTTTQATSTVGYVADHLKVATTTDN